MSLINDALKEARRDAPAGGVGPAGQPGPTYPPPTADGKRGMLIGMAVVVAVFCLLLVATVVLVLRLYGEVRRSPGTLTTTELATPSAPAAPPTTGPGAAAVETAVPPVAAPQPPPEVAAPPTDVPATTPVAKPVAPPPIQAAKPTADVPSVPAQPVASPPAAAAGTAAAPSEAPVAAPPAGGKPVTPPAGPAPATAEIQRLYPLKGIMKGRRGNTALIGSQIVAPGDRLPAGGEVVEVAEEHVVVRHAGVDYLLFRP